MRRYGKKNAIGKSNLLLLLLAPGNIVGDGVDVVFVDAGRTQYLASHANITYDG